MSKWINLIFCLFKGSQSCLVEFLQKAKILASRTRDIVHNAVYALFTIVTGHCWFDVCQHLPVGFHHLFIPSKSIIKLDSLLQSFKSPGNKYNKHGMRYRLVYYHCSKIIIHYHGAVDDKNRNEKQGKGCMKNNRLEVLYL